VPVVDSLIAVYLAGPLFGVAEREFNVRLAAAIQRTSPGLRVVLPQERAEVLMKQPNKFQRMFEDCLNSIEKSNVVVAILDGPDADSGTSLEVALAFARGAPIVGVRTDIRASEEDGLTLMLKNACTELVSRGFVGTDELATLVCHAIVRATKSQSGNQN